MTQSGYLQNRGKLPQVRRRTASVWWLVLLILPPLVTALLPDAPQTPAPRDNYEIGVFPQDRTWLCAADGSAGCSAGDFLSAYKLDGPAYRAFGDLVQERIGTGRSYDPGRVLILNQKRKCTDGSGEQCRGQVTGL